MKIKLPCFGIEVETINGHGSITSDLESDVVTPVGAALHVVEAMVLAHACAGVDISSPKYLEGIETVVDAIWNNV